MPRYGMNATIKHNDNDHDVERNAMTMTMDYAPTKARGRAKAGGELDRDGYVLCALSNGRTARASKVVDTRYLKLDFPKHVPSQFIQGSSVWSEEVGGSTGSGARREEGHWVNCRER